MCIKACVLLVFFTFLYKVFYAVVIACAAVVMGETADEVYSSVKDVIRDQSGPVSWIPSADPL